MENNRLFSLGSCKGGNHLQGKWYRQPASFIRHFPWAGHNHYYGEAYNLMGKTAAHKKTTSHQFMEKITRAMNAEKGQVSMNS